MSMVRELANAERRYAELLAVLNPWINGKEESPPRTKLAKLLARHQEDCGIPAYARPKIEPPTFINGNDY